MSATLLGQVVSGRAYRRVMFDAPMRSQQGRIVLVVLQDGTQLEGELHMLTDRFEIGRVVFEAWEIETLEDSPDV